MTLLIVCLASFSVSALTLYTGFGLGTVLLPVFSLFFPLRASIAATALVHATNSLFKFLVAGKLANRTIVVHFGIPAVLSALAGALVLGMIPDTMTGSDYAFLGMSATVTPLNIAVGSVMLLFVLTDFLPFPAQIPTGRKWLCMGGIASGFFGGFSGHQGALRTAFLRKADLSAQELVGTHACIGLMVDLCRMFIYGLGFLVGTGSRSPEGLQWSVVVPAMFAACSGVLVSRLFTGAVTLKSIRVLTAVCLILMSLAMGAGIL